MTVRLHRERLVRSRTHERTIAHSAHFSNRSQAPRKRADYEASLLTGNEGSNWYRSC